MNKEYTSMTDMSFLIIDRQGNTCKIPIPVWEHFLLKLTPEMQNDIIVPTMKKHKTKKDLIDDIRAYLRGEL